MSTEIAKSMMLLATEYEFVFETDRIKIWMKALEPYGDDLVTRAVAAFMTDPIAGRFKPKLADIIGKCQLIQGGDGRPGDGEAWAIALQARDESATVIINADILGAWSAARPVFQSGDETGARMAFRDAYNRLVQKARTSGEPLKWIASLGTDAAQRESVIKTAVNAGLIAFDKQDVLLIGYDEGMPVDSKTHTENMAKLREQLAKLVDPAEKLANIAAAHVLAERGLVAQRKAELRDMAMSSDYRQ